MKNLFEEAKPIGAVVKEADLVFSNLSRNTRTNGSFNRLEWQLFILLKERIQVTEAAIKDYLSFLAPGQQIQKTISRFIQENLLLKSSHGMYLSLAGEKVFEELVLEQEKIKEKAVEGISTEAYNITVKTLQKIVDNLQEFVPETPRNQSADNSDSSSDLEQLKKIREDKIKKVGRYGKST